MGDMKISTGRVQLWTVPEPETRPTEAPQGEPPAPSAVPLSRPSNPLDAAFQRTPRLPTLVTSTLNEETERAVIAERGPSLVAYGRFDPSARPVVLVHGVNGSPATLTALADQLTAAGRQVYLFHYSDLDDTTTESGVHLARALRELRAETLHGDAPLEIVGHSMGGVVARVALNELQRNGVPRAGFPSVRVQNLDTSQGGAYDGSGLQRQLSSPIVGAFMRIFGFTGLTEMRSSSALFAGLYATDLPDVTFSNLTARDPNGRSPSHTLNVHDFDAPTRSAIANYLATGVEPRETLARNYARALTRDVHGDALRARLVEEMGTRTPDDALVTAFDAVMPQFARDHGTIATDATSPAIARIVQSLQ